MKLVRLDRTEIEVFTINGKTFRFIRNADVTGQIMVTADEWSGWTWMRRHGWIGERS